jgi:hypothetical protein
VSLAQRTVSPLGVYGMYALGHFFLRGKTWHLKHGYVERDDPRANESVIVDPNFKFERPSQIASDDYAPAMY